MPSNTVEIVVKVLDQATSALTTVTNKVTGLKLGIGALATVVGASLAVGSVFRKIVDESEQAEEALSRFNLAFANVGKNTGVAKQDMLDFAATIQRTTKFTDEAVLEAESVLFRFGSLTGETFKRARADIVDVAAAMQMDLASAANMVGRALENPAQGMRMLRQMGVVLSASQQELIRNLMETGRQGEAQAIILGELEKRYKGAAEAAGRTLAGAVAKLRNSFGELFEMQNTESLSNALEDLNKLISDPEFKENIQSLFKLFVAGAGAATSAVGKLAGALDKIGEGLGLAFAGENTGQDEAAGVLKKQLRDQEIALKDMDAKFKSGDFLPKGTSKWRIFGMPSSEELKKAYAEERQEAVRQIELTRAALEKASYDVRNPARDKANRLLAQTGSQAFDLASGALAGNGPGGDGGQKAADAWAKHLADMQSNTATAMEKIEQEFKSKQADIAELLSKHIIEPDVARARASEAAEAYIDGMNATLKKMDLGELMREQLGAGTLQAELDKITDMLSRGLIDDATAASLGQQAGDAYGEALKDAIEAKLNITKDVIEKSLDVTALVDSSLAQTVKDSQKITDDALSDSKLKLAQMRGGVDDFVDTLSEGLKNAAREGKLSMGDLVRYIISQLLSKALMNAIDEFGNALKGAFSSGGGGGGFLSSLVGGFMSLFGAGGISYAASGALAGGGMTMVGEEGPELVRLPKGSRVYSNSNTKQMMGGNVNFAPVSNIAIVANDKDAQTLRAEFGAMLRQSEQRQQKQMLETLSRNGFGRMR